MGESSEKDQVKKKITDVKTFSVPFALGEKKENITIKTNPSPNTSKEKIINQAFKLHTQGNISEAKKYYLKLINKGCIDHRIFSNYGVILKNLGKTQEAELSTRRAIEINPNYAIAHSNLGSILRDLGNLKDAELSTRKAIELNPNYTEAHSNLGSLLRDLDNLQDAELSTRKAIELNPNFADAHYNLGNILSDLGNFYDAINSYKEAIKLNNEFSMAKVGLIETKGLICDWGNKDKENNWLDKLGIEGSYVYPLSLMYYEDKPLNQLKRSNNIYKQKYFKESKKIATIKNKKMRIGYFSSDFRAHPTMYLISSILKLHDKSKFDIYLYSFAPNEDEYTDIAKNSGCIFKDIKGLTDNEAVELARNDQLNIAIDLMGYIKNSRMDIFSYRVAPIQINYLAFPGTLGNENINYIIADKILIPNGYEKFYSEKIIRMPNCYQCNDNTKEICKETVSRKDFDLPEKGFIFTCFNANKKITPKEFDIWMRLIREIKGSVLWLYQSNQYSIDNLIKEAEKRKVESNRLIFAKKLPLNKHLARHSLGDLGLDTFNYNGHTTTSDALWAGLPVLTKIGQSFAARVSASLLTTIGLPELITYNEKDYEEKALNIARHPNELIKLKSKLAELIETSPLYNSALFTKDLESKFEELIINK